MSGRDRLGSVAIGVAAVLVGAATVAGFTRGPSAAVGQRTHQPRGQVTSGYLFDRLTGPARTVVRDGSGAVVAVLTDGSRTARLSGAPRTFADPRYTTQRVHTEAWVRLLPRPWGADAEQAGWFTRWLPAARVDRSPDLLEITTQYLARAPERRDRNGVRFTGDARYRAAAGADGRRDSPDFHDYLGVRWTFPGGEVREPADGRYGAVDGAGFVRLVFGYRLGLRLSGPRAGGTGLPRTTAGLAARGGGTVIARGPRRAPPLDQLQEGDLVFFADRTGRLTQVGVHLGRDAAGRPRFIASRSKADGPTFGDVGGQSLLSGDGHYAKALRLIRRL